VGGYEEMIMDYHGLQKTMGHFQALKVNYGCVLDRPTVTRVLFKST